MNNKTKSRAIKAIALKFGYVETHTTPWLVFSTEYAKAKSRKEALDTFVEYLYQKYILEKYNALKRSTFDLNDWHSWLLEFNKTDCNSYGTHEDLEDHNPLRWNPWHFDFNVPEDNMIVIVENAENILTHVLGLLHPKLKDIDVDYFGLFEGPEQYAIMIDEKSVRINGMYGFIGED